MYYISRKQKACVLLHVFDNRSRVRMRLAVSGAWSA